MTTDAGAPSVDRGQRQRHRLVPREQLAAEYATRYGSPAVSAYALAVRDVVEGCAAIGPVDTWRRLADLICQGRPARDRARWRKKLSRHFTAESKGPPWQTVVLVTRHAVPEPDRAATLAHLGWLYRAARGDEPPTGAAAELAGGHRPAAGDPAGRERSLAEMTRQNEHLRRMVATMDREIVRLRTELRGRTDGTPGNRTTPGTPPRAGQTDRTPGNRSVPGMPPQTGRRGQNGGHFPPGHGGPTGQQNQPRPDLTLPGRSGRGPSGATYLIDDPRWHAAPPAPAGCRPAVRPDGTLW